MKVLPFHLLSIVALGATITGCSHSVSPTINDYRNGNPDLRITPQSICHVGRPCSGGSGGPCDINSTTVATSPINRSRTTIGVGEQVVIDSLGTLSVTGDGTLSSSSSPTTLSAGDQGGSVTVRTGGYGKTCSAASKVFTVIPPATTEYHFTTGPYHQLALANIGMYSNIWLTPDTVSFQFVHWREQQANASAWGAWLCQDGQGHTSTLYDIAVDPPVPGFGSQVSGVQDWAYSGSCSGPQIQTSDESIVIPTQYHLPSDLSVWFTINSVTQHATEDSSGNLSLSKSIANTSTTVNSSTNPVGWHP